MIIINTSQIDYSQIIINTINQLFSTLFSSLDKSLYSLLDKSVFVDESILSGAFFKTIFQNSFGLPTIADALLVGFAIYYCFRLSFAQFSGTVVEKPYQFLTKILIVAVCINCSSFICEQFLRLLRSLAYGEHRDDRRHTDDNAKCGEERPQFVGGNGAEGYF